LRQVCVLSRWKTVKMLSCWDRFVYCIVETQLRYSLDETDLCIFVLKHNWYIFMLICLYCLVATVVFLLRHIYCLVETNMRYSLVETDVCIFLLKHSYDILLLRYVYCLVETILRYYSVEGVMRYACCLVFFVLFNDALSIQSIASRIWWLINMEQSMKLELIGRNRTTQRNPAPMLLFPPQIPRNLTWDWTRSTAVGSRQI
jgi:hypothetical protein